jgi:cyclin-dependent kinase regulatory subunit CKS1
MDHSKMMSYEKQMEIQKYAKDIYYSDKYTDDEFEYRHVMLPKELAKLMPKNHLMSEAEWRSYGVQQSRGWQHYLIHEPEPHILLFRRPVNYGQQLTTQDQNKMQSTTVR